MGRVSVWEYGDALEVGGNDGHTTMWKYLVPLNCTLEDGYNGKFYVMQILPQ